MSSILPMSIDDVGYDRNAWKGDLVVTQGVIYFFPLSRGESKDARAAGWLELGHYFGWIGAGLGVIVALVSSELRSINNSFLHKNGMWRRFDSSEQLQRRLDSYIEALKQKQGPEEFSGSLPRPLRIAKSDVKDLQVTLSGKLIIETQYDKHDFDVGLKRKKVLRAALQGGGLWLNAETRTAPALPRTSLR